MYLVWAGPGGALASMARRVLPSLGPRCLLFFCIASLPFLFIIQFDLFLTIKGKPTLSSCLQGGLLFLFCFFLLLLFAVLG